MSLAKKRHQKKLRRSAKKKSIRQRKHQRAIERKNQNLVKMEMGDLLTRMIDECDVDNYEEWVEKMDIRPELRQQLDYIVSEERKRIENEGTFTTTTGYEWKLNYSKENK